MEDEILEKISNKILENYDAVKNYYYDKSDEEVLKEAKKSKDYGDGSDVFINGGTLYSEIKFNKFRVTTILNYIFNKGNFNNIVGIEGKNGLKLYEKFYPYQLRKMMMGNKLHEIAEKYASTLDRFSIEENLYANIDGDTVVGRLDLAHKNSDGNTIIDIKTGKIHEDLAKIQLAIYAYMYSIKHSIDEKINVAIVSPNEVLRSTFDESDIKNYLRIFIDAKNELKNELSEGKFYVFKKTLA